MNVTPSVIRILICATLTGVTSALLYLFLKRDEEECEDANEGIRTSRPSTIEVKIPKESVGVVIGRGGSNIKEIQEKSDTKINFKDEHDNEAYRVCVIRGTPETAQLAESLIHEFISNQPLIETSEMLVPQRACGRIIGRNGENIRSIARASSAKITVENSSASNTDPFAERRVMIKGTSEQIELAKALIKEKVDEDNDLRKKLEESLANRSPRKKERQNFLTAGEDSQASDTARHPSERLVPTGSDGLMEVYVSAVQHPEQFWLQVIGPRAVELDHLVDQMSEYYRKDENRELHAIRELTVGQVVAAPFSYDEKWYRAEVTDITEDEYDPQESKVALYYVDYGDSDDLKKKDVLELRTDFLRLRFQAIECSLAKVLPRDGKWSDEAVDLFEELTHVAQWVVVMARVDSYKEREHRRRGRREGSPVPCIELFESKNSQDISVGEELVKQGFAEWEKSRAATVSNGESAAIPIDNAGTSGAQKKKTAMFGQGDGDQPQEEEGTSTDSLQKNGSTSPGTGGGDASPVIDKPQSAASRLLRDDLVPARGQRSMVLLPDESDEGSSDELEMC